MPIVDDAADGGGDFNFDFGNLFGGALSGLGGGMSKGLGGILGGAASDIFGGIAGNKAAKIKAGGLRVEAENYRLAAALAEQNASFTRQSTGVKLAATDRAIYQATGKQAAEIAGSNLGSGGTALDLMRSSVQQGAISKQLVGQQGLITEAGYNEQSVAFKNMAKYAEDAANDTEGSGMFGEMAGMISGGIKLAALFI